MPLNLNGTTISPSHNINFNGTALREWKQNGTLVWTKAPLIQLYNHGVVAPGYSFAAANYEKVYENTQKNWGYNATWEPNNYGWYLVPWTNKDPNYRSSAAMYCQQWIDLTYYKRIDLYFASNDGYGDALHNTPRVSLAIANQVVHGFQTPGNYGLPANAVIPARFQYDDDTNGDQQVGTWGRSLDVTNVTGAWILTVSNWSAGGVSQLHVRGIDIIPMD